VLAVLAALRLLDLELPSSLVALVLMDLHHKSAAGLVVDRQQPA
jgi:hypothetical protein